MHVAKGMRVTATEDYLAAIVHPYGEEWIAVGESGIVSEVSDDFGRVYVRMDRTIPALAADENEITIAIEDADEGDTLAEHFWAHFATEDPSTLTEGEREVG
jgi:hypothetical protein